MTFWSVGQLGSYWRVLVCCVAVLPMMVRVNSTPHFTCVFIGATMIFVLFAIGFTRMGRFVGDAKAFYSYIQTDFDHIRSVGVTVLAISSCFLRLVPSAAIWAR